MGHDIQRVCCNTCGTAGDCLCCHHDGKWKCRNRSGSGRSFQSCSFQKCAGQCKRDRSDFIAMGAGLVSGMGYLGYAVLYMVILSLVMALYVQIRAWEKNAGSEKTMVITIPGGSGLYGSF